MNINELTAVVLAFVGSVIGAVAGMQYAWWLAVAGGLTSFVIGLFAPAAFSILTTVVVGKLRQWR